MNAHAMVPRIDEREFSDFQGLLHREAGIHLSPAKMSLVAGRLAKRLRHYGLSRYGDYYRLATERDSAERQVLLDLLTTNETYFFREPKHFEFLQRELLPGVTAERPFRVWSAACSSGEEPYSLAMVLDRHLKGGRWELRATDLSTRVLARAREGRYPIEAGERIPREYLGRYCLKGVRSQSGWMLIDPALRRRIGFSQLNLNGEWPHQGGFDLIFLRNVMIYFDADTKRRLVERMSALLSPGGHLVVGHSESLHGVNETLVTVRPSIYRKP